MCQGTLNLLTYVLPAVPFRQWVLSLPFELLAPLAYERNLMGAVARIFAGYAPESEIDQVQPNADTGYRTEVTIERQEWNPVEQGVGGNQQVE